MDCYFQDIEHQIIKRINNAESRILIAVAWFTNTKIGDELLKKKNIDIEIIVDDNRTNRESNNINNLQLNGQIDLTFIKDLNKKYYLMHNKFCVIDNKHIITGSYNWTNNAKTNDENITVISDSIIAASYSQEFRRIKNIELQEDSFFYSDEEIKEISQLIYDKLVDMLTVNISKLEKNLLFNWIDFKIINRIRAIEERIRNKAIIDSEKFIVNSELVGKYGIRGFSLFSVKEKIELRDTHKKNGLEKIDYYINRQFQLFKIRGIQKLQMNYNKLLLKEIHNETKVEKIIKVVQFISQERVALGNNLEL